VLIFHSRTSLPSGMHCKHSIRRPSFVSIIGPKEIPLRTFERSAKESDGISVGVDDSSQSCASLLQALEPLEQSRDAGRSVTPVALASRSFALVGLILLVLPLLVNGRAEAQREVVEDSWAQAEAVMAADPAPRPRATRAERRAALMQRLRWQAAEAHVIRPGDVQLQLWRSHAARSKPHHHDRQKSGRRALPSSA